MERNPATPETINPDLSFADADAVQTMRYQNEALLPALYEDARAKFGASNDLLAQAEHHDEIEQEVQMEAAKAYADSISFALNGHMRREDNPALYDRLQKLFYETSPVAMSHTEWQLGELDDEGKPVNVSETSGRSRLQREIAKLQAGDYSTDDAESAELQRILDRDNQLNPEEQAAKDEAELQATASDADAELQRAIDRDNQLNPEEQAAKDEAEREMLEKQAEADTDTDTPDTDTDDADHDDVDDDTKQIDDPNLGLPYSSGKHEADRQMLVQARQKLAELSVQRRQMIRKRGRKAKRLEAEYKQAQDLYDTLVHDVNRYQVHDMRINGRRKEEIRGELVHNLLTEHQEFSKTERAILEADDSRRARFARWWDSKGGKITNVVVSFAMGFGIKAGVKGLAGAAVAGAAPAAIAAGIAISTTKAALVGSVGNRVAMNRSFDARFAEDHEDLKSWIAEDVSVNDDHDEQVKHASNALQDAIDTRVAKDREANFKRVRKAALIAGGAGLAGAGLESILHATGVIGSHGAEHHGATGGNHGHGGHTGGHNGGGNTAPKAPENYGFQPNINVANGEGYQQALTQLAAEQHISLSPDQSWALYEHLNDKFNGHFFTDNPSFHMNNAGEWGISHPGNSTWSPAVLEEANNWLKTNR